MKFYFSGADDEFIFDVSLNEYVQQILRLTGHRVYKNAILYSANTPTIVAWIAHNTNAKIYSSYNAYQMFKRVTEIFSPALKKWSLSDSFVPDFS